MSENSERTYVVHGLECWQCGSHDLDWNNGPLRCNRCGALLEGPTPREDEEVNRG